MTNLDLMGEMKVKERRSGVRQWSQNPEANGGGEAEDGEENTIR